MEKVEFKPGGALLGVNCGKQTDLCVIEYVKPGSAAANAGLERNDVVVSYNEVSHVTKIGIDVYVPTTNSCDGPSTTRDVLVHDNLVHSSHTGYTLNGGCFISRTTSASWMER